MGVGEVISALFPVFLEVLISCVQVQMAASAPLYLTTNLFFTATAGSGEEPPSAHPPHAADGAQIY